VRQKAASSNVVGNKAVMTRLHRELYQPMTNLNKGCWNKV